MKKILTKVLKELLTLMTTTMMILDPWCSRAAQAPQVCEKVLDPYITFGKSVFVYKPHVVFVVIHENLKIQ